MSCFLVDVTLCVGVPLGVSERYLVDMTRSRMLYNSESNGGPFSKVVFKS